MAFSKKIIVSIFTIILFFCVANIYFDKVSLKNEENNGALSVENIDDDSDLVSTYNESVSKFVKIKPRDFSDLISNAKYDHIFLYVGRGTCPICLDFAPKLEAISTKNNITIYYIDSEKESKELNEFRDKYNIEFVPELILYRSGSEFITKLDEGDDLSDFLLGENLNYEN